MDGKVFVYIILLVAVIGSSYGIYQSTQIDDANREYALVEQQNGTLEGHIRTQAAYLELRKEVAAMLKVVEIMQKEVNSLRDEIVVQRDKEVQARRDFEQAILRSRQDAAGLLLDEAVLPSGLRLRNARVQKVEGDITTIIHSEGISKLSPEMLPLELQDRFRFGMPLVGASQTTAPTPAPVVTPSVSMPAAPQKDKLKEGQLLLEKLRKELPYLEEELAKAESDTASAASPSRRFYAKNRRDSVSQQITALKRRIDAVELEIKKLQP